MIAVTTENGSLLIYSHSTLVWCAELPGETIAITVREIKSMEFNHFIFVFHQRGNFISLAGAIVTLNSTGQVTVGFLGSNPSVFKVPPMGLSRLDYDKSKQELEEMEREINSSVDNSGNNISRLYDRKRFYNSTILDIPFINASAEKDLQIKSHLDFENLIDGEFCKLQLKLIPTVNLEQVQLVITPNSAFVVLESSFFLKDLRAYEEQNSLVATVYASESQVSELFMGELNIMVSFINKQSIARVIKHKIDIPMKHILNKSSPQKDGMFKVTLSVQKSIDFGSMFAGRRRVSF